jgi:hypothetical protein
MVKCCNVLLNTDGLMSFSAYLAGGSALILHTISMLSSFAAPTSTTLSVAHIGASAWNFNEKQIAWVFSFQLRSVVVSIFATNYDRLFMNGGEIFPFRIQPRWENADEKCRNLKSCMHSFRSISQRYLCWIQKKFWVYHDVSESTTNSKVSIKNFHMLFCELTTKTKENIQNSWLNYNSTRLQGNQVPFHSSAGCKAFIKMELKFK